MKTTDLDHLLQTWASRQEPDAARLEALAAQTVQALQRQRLAHLAAGSEAAPAPSWQRYLLAAAAGAVVACLAMALYGGLRKPAGPAPEQVAEAAALLIPASLEQAGSVQVYQPINELFSGRLLWLVETDKDIRLGLPGNGAYVERPGDIVIVRTIVLTRSSVDSDWRRLWEVTAAARPEQSVQTPLDASADAHLALWVYPMADGAVAVDTALDLRQPVALSVNASNVFVADKPIRILSMQTATAEFQVLQVVRLVPAEPKGA